MTKQKNAAKPTGKVARILKLASRPNGASRAELNKLTGWRGAPWRWLFTNPKRTGYADRWNYKFSVIEGEDGEVRYHVAKKGGGWLRPQLSFSSRRSCSWA
jgi:hypothetical protein